MKKTGVSAWFVGILVCSFLLFGGFGVSTARAALAAWDDSPVLTVSTGDVAVQMHLAAFDVGDLYALDLAENTEVEFPLDAADVIYFQSLSGDGEIVPFYFRCDGNAWQFCAEMLLPGELNFTELELFVGELPVEEYTVTFSWGEESESVTVAGGARLEERIPPVPEGERFLGWYDGETPYDFQAEVHRNMTLTARFEKVLCQLTYYIDDIVWVSEIYEYGAEIELKRPNEREGYRFVGWEDTEGIAVSPIKISKHLEVKAVWMKIYTVSFYTEEGFLARVLVDEGETVAQIAAPERDGFEFSGWFSEETPYDFSTAVREDTVLTAKYIEKAFRVDFYVHGELYFSTDCIYPYRLELYAPPSVNGEAFREWLYADGTVAKEGDEVTDDLILTAVYEKVRVTIRFHAEGNPDAETEAVYGEPCVLPNAPQVTGRRFLYWSGEENGAEYSFPPVWAEGRDKEFYAVYAVCSYTITYLAEGATVEGPTMGEYAQRIAFSVLPEKGLRISKAEIYRDGKWEALEECAFLMPAENVRIRVATEVYSYFLEVVAEGTTYRVACNKTFLPPTPEREHQIFQGWFTDCDFTKAYDGVATGAEGERIYLYAKFESVKFTVTFRVGDREETRLWNHGETPAPSCLPWENDASVRFVKWSPTVAVATEDAVYTAVYESIYTKIYFENDQEIFRETVALKECNAPTLVRDGYRFDGYELTRQESNLLYYVARFSEIPKPEESVNKPIATTTPAISQTVESATKTATPSSSSVVWVLVAVLSVGAWVVFIWVRLRRRKAK